MTLRARTALAGLTLALWTAPAHRALAETPADVAAARDLFREGSQLAQEGKWEQAKARFEQSLALRRAAITLYSLGVADKQIGLFVDALENLRAFEKWPPNSATDPYLPIAREMIRELEGKIGRVRLRVTPAGARVVTLSLDGTKLNDVALETPRIVNPGAHVVKVVAADGSVGTADVNLSAGETRDVTVELHASSSPAPSASASTAASGAPRTVPPPPPPATGSTTLPIALIAGGGALVVASGVFGLLALSDASSATTNDGPEAKHARTKATVADVLGGLGLVAGGVGAYLLLSRPASGAATETGVFVGPGSMRLQLKF